MSLQPKKYKSQMANVNAAGVANVNKVVNAIIARPASATSSETEKLQV
jgi:hypothetical protein